MEIFFIISSREMETISIIRGPTFGDFVTIRNEASMQDITVARLQSTRYTSTDSPLPPLLLNVRGSWVISVYL